MFSAEAILGRTGVDVEDRSQASSYYERSQQRFPPISIQKVVPRGSLSRWSIGMNGSGVAWLLDVKRGRRSVFFPVECGFQMAPEPQKGPFHQPVGEFGAGEDGGQTPGKKADAVLAGEHFL